VQQFCGMLLRLASRADGWGSNLDLHSDAFDELARIVTLRRYHAGQSSFDIMAMPRTWLLRIHPLALPGVLSEIATGLRGLGPIVMPHLNYWRANPMMLLPGENDRAMWRIARSIERQPAILGLVASSWLYSTDVGDASPHLAWVRAFYEENGAYLVDMELAPERMGFLIGSEARRRLHAAGSFRPRNTLVIWRRDDMLTWADRYVDAEPTRRRPHRADPQRTPSWRFDANKTLSSGQLTAMNCERIMTFRPRRYWLFVFLIPCLLAAAAASFTFGVTSVFPIAIGATFLIWLLQYFFLQ
jgi:hypothetical protein